MKLSAAQLTVLCLECLESTPVVLLLRLFMRAVTDAGSAPSDSPYLSNILPSVCRLCL
jgi:hypothetical protein